MFQSFFASHMFVQCFSRIRSPVWWPRSLVANLCFRNASSKFITSKLVFIFFNSNNWLWNRFLFDSSQFCIATGVIGCDEQSLASTYRSAISNSIFFSSYSSKKLWWNNNKITLRTGGCEMTAGCESRILLSLSLNDVADRTAVLGCSHIAFRRREKITVANSSIQLDSAYSQLLFAVAFRNR